jgi:hypothetical protein
VTVAKTGIDFSILPTAWKDCTGYAPQFASERIEQYVTFPAAGFDTKTPASFSSPLLREPLFFEARHYTDRALYHLAVGKWMVCNNRPTWGLVSYYYSSFFSAQAAIRLRGTFFVKVNYDSETNPPPTHQLDVVNLLTDEFQIRQTSRKGGGEHQKVWAAFYELYKPLSTREGWAKFKPITAIDGDELRLAEMHRRHLLNYVPGHGYHEVRSPKHCSSWCKRLSADLAADLMGNLHDEDCQLEVRALLRLELCLQLFHRIAGEGGAYELHHEKITKQRCDYLVEFECPKTLATRIENALTP